MPLRRKIIAGAIAVHTAFLIPFVVALLLTGVVYYDVSKLRFGSHGLAVRAAAVLNTAARIMYFPAKPLFMLLHVDPYISRGLHAGELAGSIGGRIDRIGYAAARIAPLILSKDVTQEQLLEADRAVDTMKSETAYLSRDMALFADAAPFDTVRMYSSITKQGAEAVNSLDLLLGRSKEQRLVVFFLNNRELRPGGGFIGSLAFITMRNYSVQELRVEDVYEIDGQITSHSPPHPAVAKYLEVPHLFLRDSNFSPDFAMNVQTAEKLMKETGRLDGINGAVGITTTAIENILGVLGTVPVPDFDQTVSKDNFYIVTQSAVEQNFFPGSIQKRSFLSSLMRSILLAFESADKKALARSLIADLDRKNIVAYSRLKPVENLLVQNGWAGALTAPVDDYLYPVEANVGANKANYFVRREMKYNADYSTGHDNTHEFTVLWRNESPGDSFLAGTYKNYFQLYVPAAADVKEVSLNGTLYTNISESVSAPYRIIGAYVEIPPGASRTLSITYTTSADTGKTPYSLVVQKQTGAQNSDIQFSVMHPSMQKLFSVRKSLEKDLTITFP